MAAIEVEESEAHKLRSEEIEAAAAEKPSVRESKKEKKKREKMKRKMLKETEQVDKRGVCYLSRIPPKMDPLKLRQLLSSYGEILRIYLTPEVDAFVMDTEERMLTADPEAQIRRKRSGGFRGQEFSEGWVEFSDKRVAKRVANMLNGEQIGGRKRSKFYFDIWNIKYLSKFKWDDLTEETACKNATREQKLRMELSAAKKERDFYLNKVDQARALSEIEGRRSKRQKVENGLDSEGPKEQQKPKVIRQFPQRRPFSETAAKSKRKLSKDVLAEIFSTGNDEA